MSADRPAKWFVLDSGPGDAAFNMALDEALLEFAATTGAPVLRFYGWTEPAASFGYSQRAAEIERLTACRPLVRRPTGGGLVPHNADWTYSVIVPPGHTWHSLRAPESYERIHRWLQNAFALWHVPVALAPCCRKEMPGQCFAGYEQSDVLYLGRKIAGAAQRRNKCGLLIQGSVQPPPAGLSRTDWQQAMLSVADDSATRQWASLMLPAELCRRAGELATAKYSQRSYNFRR
jgi:lipoate-protein ligase A